MEAPKSGLELQAHMIGTYISLRYGMAVIGAALPFVLAGIGLSNGIGLADSISAYYWVTTSGDPSGDPPARNWLVGTLFAIAACLYLYKGFKTRENLALNAAAIFAVGVALIPTPWNCKPCPFTLHGTSAVLLFGCLVYVVWFHAGDTLDLLNDPTLALKYRRTYQSIGLFMLASPAIAFALNWTARGESYIFLVEATGICTFAAFWFVKSKELKKSAATINALRGAVKFAPDGKAKPAPETAQGPAPLKAA